MKVSIIARADRFGGWPIARASLKWVPTGFNGLALIPPLTRCAAPKKVPPKAITPRTKAHFPATLNWRFWRGGKEILQAWFRTGSAYASNGIVEFVKQLLSSLPNRMRIIVRADRGYFVGALLDLLDAYNHGAI